MAQPPPSSAPYFQHLAHHISSSLHAIAPSRPHTVNPTLNDISLPQLTCTFKVDFKDTKERWDAKCFFPDPDMARLMGWAAPTPALKESHVEHQRARARRRAADEVFTRERLRLLAVTSSVPAYFGCNVDPPPGLPSIVFLSSPVVAPLTPDTWARASVRTQDAVLSSLAKHVAEVVRGCVRATEMYRDKGRAGDWDALTWFRRRTDRRVGDVVEGRKMGDLRAAKSLRDAIDDLLAPYSSLEQFVPMLHHMDLSSETLTVTSTWDVFVPITPTVPSPLPLHVILSLPSILQPLASPASLPSSLLRQRSSYIKSLFHHLHTLKLESVIPVEVVQRLLGDWRAMVGLGCAAGVWGEEGWDVWQRQWGRTAKGWESLHALAARSPLHPAAAELDKSEWSFHGDDEEDVVLEEAPPRTGPPDFPEDVLQARDLEGFEGDSDSSHEIWYDAEEGPSESADDIPPPVPPKPKQVVPKTPSSSTRRTHSSMDAAHIHRSAPETGTSVGAAPNSGTPRTPDLLYATSPVSPLSQTSAFIPATPLTAASPPTSGRKDIRRRWSMSSTSNGQFKVRHHGRKNSTQGNPQGTDETKGPPVRGLGMKGLNFVRVGLGRLSRKGSMESLAN